jgi:hypothetical protein
MPIFAADAREARASVPAMPLGAGARNRLTILLQAMLGEEEAIARDVASFFDRYLAGVPPLTAVGLRVMIFALLWFPILFIGVPLPASSLSPAARERYMNKWTHARIYFVREGFFLVKAVALFGWGAHPAVRARFAMPPVAAPREMREIEARG